MCGRPREGALAALSAAEPFDRGFYSGPFGWISGAAAEFAVAIRSALVHGDSSIAEIPMGALLNRQHIVSMYAGVGLVCGSDADKEWQVRTFCRVFSCQC